MSSLRGFGLARVQAQLEHSAKALAELGRVVARIGLPSRPGGTDHLDGLLTPAPAVAALVALGLAERPEPLHPPRTVGDRPDGAE